MHFCVLATRVHGAFSWPRKIGLNWFMPALVKSNVGSSCGTTGELGTKVCPCFCTKKSRNCWRISREVISEANCWGQVREMQIGMVHEGHEGHEQERRRR